MLKALSSFCHARGIHSQATSLELMCMGAHARSILRVDCFPEGTDLPRHVAQEQLNELFRSTCPHSEFSSSCRLLLRWGLAWVRQIPDLTGALRRQNAVLTHELS